MARGFIQQQTKRSARIRIAQKTEKGLKGLLAHIPTPKHNAMPRARVERTKQDAFGIVASNGNHRLFAPQRPRPAEHGKQAQDSLILKEPDGLWRQVLQLPHNGPFFCARWGCFSE